jgi:hypothetical protein
MESKYCFGITLIGPDNAANCGADATWNDSVHDGFKWLESLQCLNDKPTLAFIESEDTLPLSLPIAYLDHRSSVVGAYNLPSVVAKVATS